MTVNIEANEQRILELLWQRKALSRWEIHELIGVTPNEAGREVAKLIKSGLLRERVPNVVGPGRPRVPVEIDPVRRYVLGLAIRPGHIESARLNLLGGVLGRQTRVDVPSRDQVIPSVCRLVQEHTGKNCVGIGLSTPGFVDPDQHQIIASAAVAGETPVELEPVYAAADGIPVTLENDMHALAARWLMTHEAFGKEDVILAFIEDGELGAAVLVNGRPNRGCVVGANDLGHMRFFVKSDLCSCGHYGCLERICSTSFLNALDGKDQNLLERVAAFRRLEDSPALRKMTRYLAAGLANAANFMHPDRVVLVSPLNRYPLYRDVLVSLVRRRLLSGLVERVQFDIWDQPGGNNGETAGWLALVGFYDAGWNRVLRPDAKTRKNPMH